MEKETNLDVEWLEKGKEHKNIIIFTMTSMLTDRTLYGTKLVSKMLDSIKEHHIDISIEIDSASKIDSKGKEMDIILLTPELFAMKEKLEEKFVNASVKVIEKKDYATCDVERILKKALS